MLSRDLVIGVTLLVCWGGAAHAQPADSLPSWHDGAAKAAIVEFVEAVTTEGGADYVPADERVAVFDNDGTLWTEQPIYTQLAFALDRIRALAPEHPEWREQQPFKAVLEDDLEALKAAGMEGVVELVMASHAGMTTDEFAEIVEDWIDAAAHPRFERRYTELVYQPMLELLDYLRANEFETYIASGGGIEFMRPWTGEIYGIPPEQVIGSSIKTVYDVRDGEPVLVRQPEIDFIDDKDGKPVGIHKFIGRRPIAAFGNSDGDLQMLQWTTAGDGRRLGLIVRHDDALREYAYDRDSHIGRLDQALAAAEAEGWVVVSMEDDWMTIFPEEAK
ncbi:MAG TPA: HAD family hydrolase [Vicinamibacterales bacterium]|nr:HAD family hydrolase [Vicinamibacterales bacterium]